VIYPKRSAIYVREQWASKHQGGCGTVSRKNKAEETVFPAYAGMNHAEMPTSSCGLSVPCVRRDEPLEHTMRLPVESCCPHVRG